MNYAIIEINKKQYRVSQGAKLNIDYPMDAPADKEIAADNVLLVRDGEKILVGQPYVKDASVTLRPIRWAKGKKVVIFKKRRREGYRKKTGHRQNYLNVEVTVITVPSGKS